MKNIDAQIYYKKLVDFFENNPTQLHTLIGNMDKKNFYSKIKNKVEQNCTEGSDFELNRKELADIIFELFQETNQNTKNKIAMDGKFVETSFGYFSLN
jgi:hypothetical protein